MRAPRGGDATAAAETIFGMFNAQLRFFLHYWDCPALDVEWLLSTLFDASLLSP
jgi:hypothetical protein